MGGGYNVAVWRSAYNGLLMILAHRPPASANSFTQCSPRRSGSEHKLITHTLVHFTNARGRCWQDPPLDSDIVIQDGVTQLFDYSDNDNESSYILTSDSKCNNKIMIKHMSKDHPGCREKWSLLRGGLCSEVYIVLSQIRGDAWLVVVARNNQHIHCIYWAVYCWE